MISIIFKNKYKIENLNEGISLSEAIDGIAYNATINLIETSELRSLGLSKGNSIEIYDTDFETKKMIRIFNGVIWEISKSGKIIKHLTLICKERTIYLEESEDEYLFPEGQTATQRAKKYCDEWGIPIGDLSNTLILLPKTVYRNNTIYDMMLKDLKETAKKGGNLFKFRMKDKLDIVELGSNKTIWKLETIAENIRQKSSLEGIITQVKVLGKQEENQKTPVVGIYKKNTEIYGTIQKILQDEKIKNTTEAKNRAETLFNAGEESIGVSGIDINTIRAGDKVSLNGVILYVIDITHTLGTPGKMDLNLSTIEHIRRRFYSGDNI